MHSTLHDAPATTAGADHPRTTPGRGWARLGVLAGLAGIVGVQASSMVDAVYRPENGGDAAAITETLSTQVPQLLVFHLATMVAVVSLPVFAAGLRRRLAAQTRPGSLVADVAAAGLMLVAVAGLMGTALNTEFIFGLSDTERVVPEVAALYGHWVGTVNWLWVGAGLTGLAVGHAALRQGAAARWMGWTGYVLGGITLLFGISPLQYMAGFTGPLLLLVLALGFTFGDRR
ncbi:hypothetical protein [Nocardioides daphniae]|uniref:DUF4386 domain-containing protein n=1 Tax=Nocardioides daphniae TaxID=402297 RepID=A0ABQ1Q4Y3_9ACTN|nr:hypothetical protein [Nocardioides daphniae]GGD12924.1 hypothetical protein GCM10007231_09950 [Nocardioides daphniae]